MAKYNLQELLANNEYPGRGIVIGQSKDGTKALFAYFIMGRSENSRNRVFECFDGGMRTKAFDESKLSDPSLIIYNPYLALDSCDIVTNGDQTDTIYNYIKENGDDGFSFEKALYTREFEPDHPNYTPRISGIIYYALAGQTFNYKLSILKSAYGNPEVCNRHFYGYSPRKGIGHFIHTYKCDGNPIPSFEGEPEEVELPNTAQELADIIWANLNENNKVSLIVKEVDLTNGKANQVVINKNI